MEHLSPQNIWLVAGVALVILETIGASGIGFIFAGLGAIVVGALMQMGTIGAEDTVLQFTVFFIATAFWAAVLWKILKRSHLAKESYSNMIGDTAFVGSQGISKGKPGEVTWSGTIMRAELAKDSAAASLPAGSQVTIIAVKGATLTVVPKE